MSPEDILLDKKLLSAMRASVNAAHDIARRSLELIEQSRIMLRELDIRGADESRKNEGSNSFPFLGKPEVAHEERPHKQ